MTPGSTSGQPPSPPGDSPPRPIERLNLDPYDGPKSHHASRAFAEMQVRARKRRKRKKIAIVLAALVLGGGAILAVSLQLSRWFSP